MIRPTTGNLLDAQTDALVNTVNCVGVMGKGIALQFKQAWPGMFDTYRKAARAGQIQPGRMHVFETGLLVPPRFIINFPTKRHWKGASRMEDIEAGLVALVEVVQEHGIRSIAIPPLGAGNGGLDWAEVRPRIVAAFASLPEVEVLLYEPQGEPTAQDRRVAAEPLKLTPARALFLRLMELYRLPGYDLTLLEVQKLAYFLQVAGQPLRLSYKAHFYGPYAHDLQQVLRRMEGHFLRVHRTASGSDVAPGARVELMTGASDAAARFLVGHEPEQARLARVAALIEGYETPHAMELLATVHWVATNAPEAASSIDTCIQRVYEWQAGRERKKQLFTEHHIRTGWQHLQNLGWIGDASRP